VRDDTAEVTLVEGRVEVTDQSAVAQSAASSSAIPSKRARTELSVGQAVAVMPIGISDVKPVSLIKTTAWLEGRLVFENERLQDAIAEVNRYSPVRLVVIDKELAELRLSGVFRTGRAENFVESLRTSFAVEAHNAPDGTLILQPVVRPKS
jgi:transmembrane sensor